MIRAVILLLLVVIGGFQWVYSNIALLALAAWHFVSTIMLDPGHMSPVVFGGVLIFAFVAVMLRHVTLWLLTYAAMISVPVSAFLGTMMLMTPSNLANRGGAGESQHMPVERVLPIPADAALRKQ